MTQEEAVELLEIFQRDEADPPRLDSGKLAYAYIAILGSLRNSARSSRRRPVRE